MQFDVVYFRIPVYKIGVSLDKARDLKQNPQTTSISFLQGFRSQFGTKPLLTAIVEAAPELMGLQRQYIIGLKPSMVVDERQPNVGMISKSRCRDRVMYTNL